MWRCRWDLQCTKLWLHFQASGFEFVIYPAPPHPTYLRHSGRIWPCPSPPLDGRCRWDLQCTKLWLHFQVSNFNYEITHLTCPNKISWKVGDNNHPKKSSKHCSFTNNIYVIHHITDQEIQTLFYYTTSDEVESNANFAKLSSVRCQMAHFVLHRNCSGFG